MASRYWVGGTASWDGTAGTKWALTSGGAGGEAVPTATDDVFFDGASGVVTVTVDITSYCLSLNFTGFTGTWAGFSTVRISGSLTLGASMTRSYTGTLIFKATTTGHTLTFNGKTTSSYFTFNGIGGGWTVQDTWNNGTSDIDVTNGTLNTNGQTITCDEFEINPWGFTDVTLAVNLGASTINCRKFHIGTTTGLTFNAGTSTIAITGINAAPFYGAGLTFNNVTITSTSTSTSALFFLGANTFANLTITGPANKTLGFSFYGNQVVTGTFTANGNSLTNRLRLVSDILGTSRTITAAVVSISNVDFQDITGAGAGSWSGTSIGNALGNSGITFTTPVTRYAVVAGNWSDTAMWSATSGGAGGQSVPLCHDAVILNGSSAAGTYVMDMPYVCANLTCTGFTRTLNRPVTIILYIFGNVILGSGMTFSFSTSTGLFMMGRGSQTLTNATINWGSSIEFAPFGGSYTLQDNLVIVGGSVVLLAGTFDANAFNVTAIGIFSNTTTNVRVLTMGSGTWTATGSSNCWAMVTTNLTLNAGTSEIILSDGTTSGKTFSGAGITYNNVTFSGAGICQYTISGSNTFNIFKSTKTVAHTFAFTAGTTQTIADFDVEGTSGNVVTIDSTSTGTHALVKTGTSKVNSDYLNIQHSVATPALTWFAGLNSTNNQAVVTAGSGWYFGVSTFTNPGNVYSSNNVYATLLALDGQLTVEVSKDAGVSWSTPLVETFGASDTLETYGTGSTELWGLGWTRAEMVNALFRLRVSHNGISQIYKTFGFTTGAEILTGLEVAIEAKYASGTMSIDLVETKIYYGTSALPIQAGSMVYASNGRKAGEGVGLGTGVLSFYDGGSNWIAVDTGAPVDD